MSLNQLSNASFVQNALKHFESISRTIVAACGDLSIRAEVEARFEEFKDLAHKTYVLMKLIKSQEKLNPDEFDQTLLQFVLAWEKVFPNVDCFNKLHFLLEHYPDFVRRYHMCGRKSAENHESVHTLLSKLKEAVKRMTSTTKMFNTIFSRSIADLKYGVAERKEEVANKRGVGKKRGRYNTSRLSRRQDEVEFSASVFGDTVEVEGESECFVELVGIEGRIHEKFKKEYLFVKTARAPDEWVQGFIDLNTFSAVKIEEAKYACH